MNRRRFLQKFGLGVLGAAVAPKIAVDCLDAVPPVQTMIKIDPADYFFDHRLDAMHYAFTVTSAQAKAFNQWTDSKGMPRMNLNIWKSNKGEMKWQQ